MKYKVIFSKESGEKLTVQRISTLRGVRNAIKEAFDKSQLEGIN